MAFSYRFEILSELILYWYKHTNFFTAPTDVCCCYLFAHTANAKQNHVFRVSSQPIRLLVVVLSRSFLKKYFFSVLAHMQHIVETGSIKFLTNVTRCLNWKSLNGIESFFEVWERRAKKWKLGMSAAYHAKWTIQCESCENECSLYFHHP